MGAEPPRSVSVAVPAANPRGEVPGPHLPGARVCDRTVLGTLEELLPRDVAQRVIGTILPDPHGRAPSPGGSGEVEEILGRRRAEEGGGGAEGTDQPGWVCREHRYAALEGDRDRLAPYEGIAAVTYAPG